MKCTSICQVHGIHKKIPNVTMTMREQIERMLEILSLKYDQVPNFKKAVQRLARKKKIPCEGVESKFWGSGLDMSDVCWHKYDELHDTVNMFYTESAWMKEMRGRPIDNMHLSTTLFTQAVKYSPNSYAVQALVSLFMPQRLYEYGGTKLAWVHDSMLKNWQKM